MVVSGASVSAGLADPPGVDRRARVDDAGARDRADAEDVEAGHEVVVGDAGGARLEAELAVEGALEARAGAARGEGEGRVRVGRVVRRRVHDRRVRRQDDRPRPARRGGIEEAALVHGAHAQGVRAGHELDRDVRRLGQRRLAGLAALEQAAVERALVLDHALGRGEGEDGARARRLGGRAGQDRRVGQLAVDRPRPLLRRDVDDAVGGLRADLEHVLAVGEAVERVRVGAGDERPEVERALEGRAGDGRGELEGRQRPVDLALGAGDDRRLGRRRRRGTRASPGSRRSSAAPTGRRRGRGRGGCRAGCSSTRAATRTAPTRRRRARTRRAPASCWTRRRR